MQTRHSAAYIHFPAMQTHRSAEHIHLPAMQMHLVAVHSYYCSAVHMNRNWIHRYCSVAHMRYSEAEPPDSSDSPRPERPEIAAQYCEEMPEFALRLQAKAGLTGYAQVYGKYNTTPYDKLQMDLMYIAHPSLIEDLKIMLATVKILFMPESTEGVSEGQTTAMSGENR